MFSQYYNNSIVLNSANCFYRNGLPYTSEGNLVHNVLVCGIFDENVNMDELISRLSQYGILTCISYIEKENMCFAQYLNPENTAKILKNPPDPYAVVAIDTFQLETKATYNCSLNKLNNLIMHEIANFLHEFDILRFSLAFPEYKYLFKSFAKKRMETVVLEDTCDLNKLEIFEYFKQGGAYIKNITCQKHLKDSKHIANYIQHYCPNIKLFDINYEIQAGKFFRTAVLNMNSLVKLIMVDCSLLDIDLLSVPNPGLIEILNISENPKIKGMRLLKFCNVRELYIRGCDKLLPVHLMRALRVMKHLQFLDMWQCNINNHCIEVLTKYCLELEHFYFTAKPNLKSELLHVLPKLKTLQLSYYCMFNTHVLRHDLLKKFAEKKPPQLDTLKLLLHRTLYTDCFIQISNIQSLRVLVIPCQANLYDHVLLQLAKLPFLEDLNVAFCQGFSCNGLLNFCERALKLQRLNVSHCRFLHNHLIYDLINLLKSKQTERDYPLQLFAQQSGITEDVNLDKEVMQSNDLLELKFYVDLVHIDAYNVLLDFQYLPGIRLFEDNSFNEFSACNICSHFN